VFSIECTPTKATTSCDTISIENTFCREHVLKTTSCDTIFKKGRNHPTAAFTDERGRERERERESE
jgi:hypothetical protein